jgi:hypothetical protein
MKPRRVQLSRKRGFKLPPNTVVVSRPSKWGNPYKVSDYQCMECDGKTPVPRAKALPHQRAMAHRDFGAWLFCYPAGEALAAAAKKELRGKNLACWCPLPTKGEEDICHAALLLRVANEAGAGL